MNDLKAKTEAKFDNKTEKGSFRRTVKRTKETTLRADYNTVGINLFPYGENGGNESSSRTDDSFSFSEI
jgi:hypothetical protein